MCLVQPRTNTWQYFLLYRTVKNFGGQKVWRKGLLQCIGGKNFGEKACVVSVHSIRNKRRATFIRQVSKRIANETDFSLSRNCPRNKHRCIDSALPLVGWLSQG